MKNEFKVLLDTLRKKEYKIEENNNEFIITNPNDTRFKIQLLLHSEYIEVFVYDELEKNKCIECKNFIDIKKAYDFMRIFLI